MRILSVDSTAQTGSVGIVENGRISASGTHEKLLETSEIYREVYEQQVSGGDDDE